ncbi:MAG: EamA family transporter [Candidatus Cloacimonadota bacterium]|nr:MAG: EamA family transporter [Candidatus Cloacimonadota bacterium]
MSYLFVLFTIILFSTLEVTGKWIGGEVDPISITYLRFLTGGLFLLPFAIKSKAEKQIKLSGKEYAELSILGVLNVTVAMFALQLSIYYGKASIAAILISANPIFVGIFGRIILKEQVNIWQKIGIAVGLTGVAIIIFRENSHVACKNMELGIIFGLISTVSFGLYTVLSKKYIKQYGNAVTNSVSFLAGGLCLLAIYPLLPFEYQPNIFNLKNIVAILYLGIFVSGIAYVSYFKGLEKISAAKGAAFFFLKPILATILAYFFFGENINKIQILGIAVVLLGMMLQQRKTEAKK